MNAQNISKVERETELALEKEFSKPTTIASFTNKASSSNDIKEASPIEEEISRNRNSYNSQRLMLIDQRTARIAQMELQQEKLVASFNVNRVTIDEEFSNNIKSLRERVEMLMQQVSAVNDQISGEELRYERKRDELDKKLEESMSSLSVLLESERASLAVLNGTAKTPSPYSTSALAQSDLPNTVRKSPLHNVVKAD